MRAYAPLSVLMLVTLACAPPPDEPHGGTVAERAEAWRPLRSVASWVLWRLTDS